MTVLSFDQEGVDVIYEGTEFRMEKELIEEATQKQYPDVTDHEVLKLIEKNPSLSGEPRRITEIIGESETR
jgi:F420-dependent methylenetetrahydromethanopterin dehydrogenase